MNKDKEHSFLALKILVPFSFYINIKEIFW